MPKPQKRKRSKASGAKSAEGSGPSQSFLQALAAQRERAQQRERAAIAAAGGLAREAPSDTAVCDNPVALPGFDFDPLTKRYFRRPTRTVPAALPAPAALQRARVHAQLHRERRSRGRRTRSRGSRCGRDQHRTNGVSNKSAITSDIRSCASTGVGEKGRASRLAVYGIAGLLRNRECGALDRSMQRNVSHYSVPALLVGTIMQRWHGSMMCMRRTSEAFNDADVPAAVPGVCALAAAQGGLLILGPSVQRSLGSGWTRSEGTYHGDNTALQPPCRATEDGDADCAGPRRARTVLRCIAMAGATSLGQGRDRSAIVDAAAAREGGRCAVRWGPVGALDGLSGSGGLSLPLASATLGAGGYSGKVYIHRFDLGSAAAPSSLTLLHRFEPAPFTTLRTVEWAPTATCALGSGVGPHFCAAFEGRGQSRAMALTVSNANIVVNTEAKFGSGVMAQAWAQPHVVLNGQRDGTIVVWDTRAARLAGAAARVNGCCTCLHVSNNGARLLVAAARRKHSTTRDSPLMAFDLRMCRDEPGRAGGIKSKALFTLHGHRNAGGRPLRFALDPTQQFIAMGGDIEDSAACPDGGFRGCVRVWSLRDGGALLRCLPLDTLQAHPERSSAPTSVSWVPSSAALQLLPGQSTEPFRDACATQRWHWDAALSLQDLQLWATGPAGLHATLSCDTCGDHFGLSRSRSRHEGLLD